MFENELRQHVGRQVQIVTATDVVVGVLISVTSTIATVRTAPPPYGDSEDVPVALGVIAYVRVFL